MSPALDNPQEPSGCRHANTPFATSTNCVEEGAILRIGRDGRTRWLVSGSHKMSQFPRVQRALSLRLARRRIRWYLAPMRFLTYAGLEPGNLERSFDKVRDAIERDDFRSADVKKLSVDGYYRARLDASNRILLKFLDHGGERACLALEFIRNHAYDKSRFLRGATCDTDKVELPNDVDSTAIASTSVRYIHPERCRVEFLDKPISFDDTQDAVARTPPPVLLVGSAGSGKTAVALSRLREAAGAVAYITRSAYLAENASRIYHAYDFAREDQETVFLSQRELLESIRV